MMGLGVEYVRVLIGPETVFDRPEQVLNSREPGLKKFACSRVGFGDQIDLCTVGLEQTNILGGGLGVHYAYES